MIIEHLRQFVVYYYKLEVYCVFQKFKYGWEIDTMNTQNADILIKNYLQHCRYQKGLNPKTIKAYRIDLTQFSDYIGGNVYSCDKELMQKYLSELHSRYKVKSVKRKIASLKAFFSYLEDEEIVEVNPFNKLRVKLHEPFLLPKTIPFSTINLLLQCAYKKKSTFSNVMSYQYQASLRDVAVLELLFATGMRVSELCSIRVDTIDLNDGVIKIYGKGAKERMIQIGNPDVLSAVLTYYEAFSNYIHKTGWFFVNRLGNQLSDQSVRNMINMYVNLAGIDQHITPHMFRHSFATLLLEEDVDIRYIQQLLGHSSITTTQIYTHVTSKKQRDILATKHPRNKIAI